MHRVESDDRAQDLQERLYRRMTEAFGEGRLVLHRLRSPWHTPSALAESHQVNGVWQSATIVHGSWKTGEDHIRVTTWRELPGQNFEPEVLPGLAAAPEEELRVGVDERTVPALLRRGSGVWQLRTAVGEHQILVNGRGTPGDLTLETVDDIVPLIEERRARLARIRGTA
ncbi:hypothetical protein [Streptomyces sp. NPDC005799]|uniref:hypothetical protein n=1 Tax=Streptomyces sp. NPDC005799 TaxID=3154678 RepID=UPI0033F0DF85